MGAETTTIPTKAAENVLVRLEMKEIVAGMDVTAVGMKEVGYMPLEVNVGMSGVGANQSIIQNVPRKRATLLKL